MTQKVIENLHEKLKCHICTLKRASKDECNGVYLSQSDIKVVNFDKLPGKYSKGWLATMPKSNDALYITEENEWYFIEFKNGKVDPSDIYRKIYDSLIILTEMRIIDDLNFSRKNIQYILVCRPDKVGNMQVSPSREKISGKVRGNAKQPKMLFELHKFRKYLFKEVYTYTPEEFEENFTKPMEEKEAQTLQLA